MRLHLSNDIGVWDAFLVCGTQLHQRLSDTTIVGGCGGAWILPLRALVSPVLYFLAAYFNDGGGYGSDVLPARGAVMWQVNIYVL